MKRQPFQCEPEYQDATIVDLIHSEAMEREVARLWPTLRRADDGTWTAPDGHEDKIEGLACLVIEFGERGEPSCMVLDRSSLIRYVQQLEMIKDPSELPAEAWDESRRIVLVIDCGSATFFWLSSTDYAPANGGVN